MAAEIFRGVLALAVRKVGGWPEDPRTALLSVLVMAVRVSASTSAISSGPAGLI